MRILHEMNKIDINEIYTPLDPNYPGQFVDDMRGTEYDPRLPEELRRLFQSIDPEY